jgi:hypothetical protein
MVVGLITVLLTVWVEHLFGVEVVDLAFIMFLLKLVGLSVLVVEEVLPQILVVEKLEN